MHVRTETHLMNLVPRPDAVMVRGAGSYIWDDTGRRYLDFVQGWAVNTLGHAPKEIVAALASQAATLLTASPAYHNARELELANRLARLSRLDRVFFVTPALKRTRVPSSSRGSGARYTEPAHSKSSRP